MNKKLLLTALLAIASTSAYADVDVYGRVAVGVEDDTFQNTTVPSTGSIQDFGSYFGVRGNEDLNGPTALIWQVEQYLDLTSAQPYNNVTANGLIAPSNGAANNNQGRVISTVNTLASGETYLGLQSDWGRMRLGNISNYMRSSMGGVDIYNYNNGVNGMSTYSRTSRILPTSIRYDSPSWNGFSLGAEYSFQDNGQAGISGVGGNTSTIGNNTNGYYSGGVYSAGLGFKQNNFSIHLGTQVIQQVGTYANGLGGMNATAGSAAAYSDAYSNRLEFAYDDPNGLIAGLGFQVASGLGWWSWANSGGAMNNYITSPSIGNVGGLNTNQYQTQEAALSLGWHSGAWTPKIGYVYGNNMMYGGSMWNVAAGTANQIANSGYQQVVAELDWNITPRTIVFVNFGQIWWGSTMQNVAYAGYNNAGSIPNVNGTNQAFMDQMTTAVGFTYTF